MENRLFILLLVSLVMIISCDDGNPLTDQDKLLLDTYGEIRDDTLYAVTDTFIVGSSVTTGFSPKLLVGTYRDFHTRSLLKFTGLPADTMRLDSVRVLLSSISTFGEKMTPLEAHVYKIQEDWDNSVNTDESWQDYLSKVDPLPVANITFDAILHDSSDFVFNLPLELVSEWQDTTGGDKNFGVLIDYSLAEHVVEFASRENTGTLKKPRIVYIYTDIAQDTTFHDTLLTQRDASLITYSGMFDDNKIFISSGFATYAFFKFDFSVLPSNINITSADFLFTQDTLSSVINRNRTQTVILRNSVTDFNLLPLFELDSTFVSSIYHNVILSEVTANRLSLDNSIKAGIGQTFVQSIINNSMTHGSFYLEYSGKGNDISVYALKGINDTDTAAKPRLRVQYYYVPNGRL